MSNLLRKYVIDHPILKKNYNLVVNDNSLLQTLIKEDNLSLLKEYEKYHGLDHILDEVITPLSLASQYGYIDIIDYLISIGADLDKGEPLIEAITRGHIDAVDSLLKAGANPNIQRYFSDKIYHTPLIVSVEGGQLEIIYHLINSGADYHIDNLVEIAAEQNNVEVLEFLINDLRLPYNKYDTLIFALNNDNIEIPRFFLKLGEDFNMTMNGEPLLFAAIKYTLDINNANEILYRAKEFGIDTNVLDKNGNTIDDILYDDDWEYTGHYD